MKNQILIFTLSLTLLSCAYRTPRPSTNCATWSRENVVYGIKQSIAIAQSTHDTKEKKTQIKKGINWAKQCITSFSDEQTCVDSLQVLENLKNH